MFCYNCGAEVPQGSIFCQQCGTKISQPTDSSIQPVPKNLQSVQPVLQNQQPLDYTPVSDMNGVLAESIATMYDRDVNGSAGFSKTEGKLILYTDHYEFKAKFGNSFGFLFGVIGIATSAHMAKKKDSCVIPYSEITSCKLGNYIVGQPTIVLTLSSGVTLSYVNGVYQKDKFQIIYNIFIQKIQEYRSADYSNNAPISEPVLTDNPDTDSVADSTAECLVSSDQNTESEPTLLESDTSHLDEFTPITKEYSFSMRVSALFTITGQGIAANGTIEIGRASVGTQVFIADGEKQKKSEHIISKIAVGGDVVEVIPDNIKRVSILFSDCTKDDIKIGDYILIEKVAD